MMIENNQQSFYQTNNNNNESTVNQQQFRNVQKFDAILTTVNENKKMDRLFYDAVTNIIWFNNAQWMFNFIRLFFIFFTLIFGLANHLIEDNKILAFVIVALCGAILQFGQYLLFRHYVLRNNKVFLQISQRLGHSTHQPITQNIQILENCVSNTIYNQLTQQNIAYYQGLNDEEKRKNYRVVANSIQDIVKKDNRGFTYFTKFSQLVGLASFIFGVIALSLTQTTPKPGILIPIILFLIIEGLYKLVHLLYLIAIGFAISLFPIILIVFIIIVCSESPTNQQGQKFDLPQSVKSTQFMINQAGGNCTICFQSFGLNKDVIQLKCSPKHMYHPLCIKAWTQVKSNCPICRAQISGVREDSVRVQLQG